MIRQSTIFPFMLVFFLLSIVTNANAVDGKLNLELNTGRDVGGACRLIFVVNNSTAQDFDNIAYQVVLFKGSGEFSNFLVLEFGDISKGRTRAFRFDVAQGSCSDLSRVLVNGVAQCVVGGQQSQTCISDINVSSRTNIAFGL